MDERGIQREAVRLYHKRPGFKVRIERAVEIAKRQLTDEKPIRVRCHAGRQPYFLVKGSGGQVYRVNHGTTDCTCPDFMQRDMACKHLIAVYIVKRAGAKDAAPAPKPEAARSYYEVPVEEVEMAAMEARADREQTIREERAKQAAKMAMER